MTRWARDPEAAADALIARCLDDIAISGSVLLVNQGGSLPSHLQARAIACTVWNRHLAPDSAAGAAPWPPPGPFDLALVRLAKAREELEMTVHAVLSALAPSGRLILYGGNDEGIRAAGKTLEAVCGAVETLAARGHGRVLAAPRPAETAHIRGTLSAWRHVWPLTLAGTTRDWVSYPGLFASGRLDDGTALLLDALETLPTGARVLDYGCGSGVIGAAALAREPSIALDLMDADAVALAAAQENVPSARVILGTALADAGPLAYDAILSNPPLHRGIAEDHALLDRLVDDAPGHLRTGGMLQIVVQRRVALEHRLGERFREVSVAAENGRYRVWRARRA